MHKILRRLAHWMRGAQLDRDVDEELEIHRAMRQQDLERRGLPPSEAVHASRRAMGAMPNAW